VNEWKAAVDEFLHSPVEVVAALFVIGGAVSGFFRNGRLFWLNIWARLRSKAHVPSETIRVVQNPNGSWWASGAKVEDKPVLQVAFYGHITEVSGLPVRVVRSEIPKPLTAGARVSIGKGYDCRRSQVLGPNESADLHADFFVDTPPPKAGTPWRSSVVFVDQYGNRHTVKRCVFGAMVPGTPPPPEPEEFAYQIADPVEKEVVSVLKAELSRYQMCGRSCGGLGSVHIVYQGRALTGVGGDGWQANSPENQLIASDPQAAELVSDNLQALMDFYKGLGSDEERDRFRRALLERLDKSMGYQGVSYFVVLALWKVGALAEALEKAKRDLTENETRFFGLSNVLMLINGLLRYRNPDFDNSMLDAIERLTDGLKEHTFLIPGKIAAIRASRLRQRQPPMPK
jgi:hypothetical protein